MPSPPKPPVNLGDDFLSEGPVSPGIDLPIFGSNRIRPRLTVYGEFRAGIAYGRKNIAGRNQSSGEMAARLDLETNLQLTGTERVHATFRPLDNFNRRGDHFTRWQFDPDSQGRLLADLRPEAAWFEGELEEMFRALSPHDRRPLDLGLAVGWIPLSFQNQYLMDDNVVGAALTKTNLTLGTWSNVGIGAFFALDEVDAFRGADGNIDEGLGNIYGGHLFADTSRRFIEATFVYLQNEDDGRRDAWFAALSSTQRIGFYNTAFRALGKFGDRGGIGAGGMIVSEVSRSFGHEHHLAYLNAYFASHGFNSVSTFNGALQRFGINWETDGLTGFPSHPNQGTDSAGGALGIQFRFREGRRQLIPELSYYNDRSPTHQDQFGAGIRFQQSLGLRTILRADALLLAPDRGRAITGIRAEIRVKF